MARAAARTQFLKLRWAKFCKLFEKEAPKTVENFIGLAEGTKEFKDPISGKKEKTALLRRADFHRVIRIS